MISSPTQSPLTFSTPSQSPPPAPTEQQPSKARLRRSTSADVIPLEAQKAAQALVRQADADLAGKFATALMEQVNSNNTGRQQPISSDVVSEIPANSTFGQLWAQFTHALRNEPFATFAKNNNIDLSNLKLTPNGWLDYNLNGKRMSLSKYDSGFEQATVNVLMVARKLSPNNQSLVYLGEHSATTRAVGNFYGVQVPNTKAGTLADIRQLQETMTFPSVLSPDAKARRPSRQEYQHAWQMQGEAEQDLALQIVREPGKFPTEQAQAGIPPLTPTTPEQPATTPAQTPGASTDPLAAIAHRQFAGEPNVYSVVARAKR